jgi:pilus assembly protein Flp/PilA
MKKIIQFMVDEQGVTAIEYALIMTLVAIIIVAAVTNLGITINGFFTTIANCVASPLTGC